MTTFYSLAPFPFAAGKKSASEIQIQVNDPSLKFNLQNSKNTTGKVIQPHKELFY